MKKYIALIISVLIFAIFLTNSCKDCHDTGDCPQPEDTTLIKGEWIKVETPFAGSVKEYYVDSENSLLYVVAYKTKQNMSTVLYIWDGIKWINFENKINCSTIYDIEKYKGYIYISIVGLSYNNIQIGDGLMVFKDKEYNHFVSTNFRTIESSCIYDNKLFIIGNFDTIANVKATKSAYFDGNLWTDTGNPNMLYKIFSDTLKNKLYVASKIGGIVFWNGSEWSNRFYENIFINSMKSSGDFIYMSGKNTSTGENDLYKMNQNTLENITNDIETFNNLTINDIYINNNMVYTGITKSDNSKFCIPIWNGNIWKYLKDDKSENFNMVYKIWKFNYKLYS